VVEGRGPRIGGHGMEVEVDVLNVQTVRE